MSPDSQLALERLRQPDGAHANALAALVVNDALATPIRDVASPAWLASQLATGLEAATHGTAFRDAVARRLEEAAELWGADDRAPRTWLIPEIDGPLRELLSAEWTPNEALTMRIIDQGVFHDVLKEVLDNSLRRFSQRMRRFDQDRLGGLGKRAKSVGRGLFGNLTEAAEGLVGAVSNELEGAVERRIDDFLAGATTEALKIVARHICDPSHAEAYGELRLDMLDVALDTPVSEWVREAKATHPLEAVDVVIAATRALVSREDFVPAAERRIATLLDAAGDGTLGAWLDEVGLLDAWKSSTTELLAARLRALVQGDPFAQWWEALHAPESAQAD